MSTLSHAMLAYAKSASRRSLRQQEADVFRGVIATLRQAHTIPTTRGRLRALADNGLLWTTLICVLSDPENAMAPELRARLVSIGKAVQREMQRDAPDFGLLIGINENIAAGLEAQG